MNPWKSQIKEAISDYLINPCLRNAKQMLTVATSYKHTDGPPEIGVLAAVTNECARIGVPMTIWAFWGYRIFFGIAHPLTWRNSTWNDYHGLRWSFTQNPASVEALHSRRHSRNAEVREGAEAAICGLFRDREFLSAYLKCARANDCGMCCSSVLRYNELNDLPGLPELDRAMRGGDAA